MLEDRSRTLKVGLHVVIIINIFYYRSLVCAEKERERDGSNVCVLLSDGVKVQSHSQCPTFVFVIEQPYLHWFKILKREDERW